MLTQNDQNQKEVMTKEDKLTFLMNKLENSLSKLEKSKISKNLENIIAKTSEYWEKIYDLLIELKKKAIEIGNRVLLEITEIVIECFCFQQDMLTLCRSFQGPDEREMNLIFTRYKMLSKPINKLLSSDPSMNLFIQCVNNGLNALCWMFNDYECDIIAKTYYESVDLPLNQIMLQKNEEEIEWLKIFKELLSITVSFVEKYNKNGLNWTGHGNNEINYLILELGATYRNKFHPKSQKNEKELEIQKLNENKNKIRLAIESGEMKSRLKPISKKESNEIKEEEANKNEKQKERTNFSSLTFYNLGVRKSFASKNKRERYEEKDNLIIFENYKNLNKVIEVEKIKISTFLLIVNCSNCTFTLNKCNNKILILNSENCNLFCDKVISDIEMINCSKIRVKCCGEVNMAIVYRSKDIVFFLEPISKNLKVRRTFSSEVMIKMAKESKSEYKEYIDFHLPEQFVFKINENTKKLEINHT